MASETPDFQAYCGSGTPRFQNDVEIECAKLLDYYRVPWDYEPRTFILEQADDGTIIEAFRPDFYLPEQDLYLEVTVMKQSLVMFVILSFVVPVVGCASADRDAASASPSMSGRSPSTSAAATDAHADCFRSGGMWHPDLKYCEYRTPNGSVAPMK